MKNFNSKIMKNIFICICLLFVVKIGFAQELVAPFAHPGLNHTKDDLERMKTKVLAGEKPWIDGWNAMCELRDAQSDFGASPKPTVGGSDGTRQRASRDATAAYYNILRWYVTGDVSHANCAVNILNAWSNSIQTEVTGELLQLPISAFMQAAELVRLYSGWQQADRERFDKMCRDYFYPACVKAREHAWPGWGGPANSDCLFIGIYLDDAEMVNDAIEFYKTGKSGGCVTEGIQFDGQPVEMGRDQPHAAIGLDTYAEFCQALWNQGVDMFSYENNLLLKGFEYYARFNLGYEVDWTPVDYYGHKFFYPAPSSNSPESMPNNRVLANELIYHHYVDRAGLDMPYLRKMMRLKEVAALTGTLYTYSDTTTAYIPYATPVAPTGLTAQGTINQIRLNWAAPAGDVANGYDIQRSTEAESGFETIAGWTENTTVGYTDKTVENGVTYYYRVRAKNQSGVSEWTNAVSAVSTTGSETIFPSGWVQTDISKEDWMIDGVTRYSATFGNTFLVTGAGRDIYNVNHPEGNFTYTAVSGDFDFIARVYDGEQVGTQLKEKIGIELRENTTTSSQKIMLWFGDNGTRMSHFIWRGTTDGGGWIDGSDHTWIPVWLRLKRVGDNFEAFVSDNGERWYSVGSSEIPFPTDCLAGVWVCSGAYRQEGYTVGFDNVSISCPEMSKPASPTNVTATAAGSTAIKLSWSSVGHISAYKLAKSTSADGPFEIVATNLKDKSYLDDNIEPSTTYYYRLWTSNAAGDCEEFVQVSATTDELNIPEQPGNINGIAGNGYVNLSWNVTGEQTEYYHIKRSNVPGGPYSVVGKSAQNTFCDNMAINGETYYYVVSAVNKIGEGEESVEVSYTPNIGNCHYWPLDEKNRLSLADIWNGQNMQLVSGTQLTDAKFLSGIRLSGGYLAMPPGIAKDWDNFTLSLWVNLDRVENWARIIDCGTGTDYNFFITAKASQTGSLRYAIKNGPSANEEVIDTEFTPNAMEWVHIVLTQEGSTGILYANGIEIGRNENLTVSPSTLGNTAQNYIGKSAYASDPYLYGIVDDIRVYDCALDTAQINMLYRMKMQNIVFDELPKKKVGDDDFMPQASATSGLPVSFTSKDKDVAEITETGDIRLVSAGMTEITANQNGNLLYAAAASVSQTLEVEDGDAVTDVLSDGNEINIRLDGGLLYISFSAVPAGRVELDIYDVNGKKVTGAEILGETSCMMDVRNLLTGVYLLKIKSGNIFKTVKIIL